MYKRQIYYSALWGIVYYKREKSNTLSKVITYQQLEVKDITDKPLEKVIEYLSVNYANPELSLVEMALKLGISQRKISDLIKSSYDLSFKQYVNNIRLNEAKRLLKETSLPVNEIAYKIGFNNVTHFNRAFKQYSNCSPQEYRSQQ